MSDMGVERKPDDTAPSEFASMRERFADQMPADFPEPSPIPMLIREIFQLSQRFERRLGASLSVNTTDLAAMEHLIQGGPMTPSELATRLEMSTAATTHVIDRLVAVGHVERQPHPVDRRKIVVTPAPASVALAFEELAPMISGVGAAAAAYDPEEQAVIAGFLRSVADLYAGLVEERTASGS